MPTDNVIRLVTSRKALAHASYEVSRALAIRAAIFAMFDLEDAPHVSH